MPWISETLTSRPASAAVMARTEPASVVKDETGVTSDAPPRVRATRRYHVVAPGSTSIVAV